LTDHVDDFSKGAAADSSLYPVMRHFGVPIDNQKHIEATSLRALKGIACIPESKPTGENAIKTGNFSDAIVYTDPISYRQYASIMVPKGRAKPTIINQKNRTLLPCSSTVLNQKGDDEEAQKCIGDVIGELGKELLGCVS
jgi:hypothetical protein